ncbi:MAG: 3-isopropylmalate dehydratase small subunit [Peptococcaceae bacterium]|jgi:3-isopropylmalate/(R)-2-methylmalate dehydratase small subunit|nr:3-isopropylmalate dehydratase small subunit [Peptococcaceae bacterium]
MTNMNYRFDGHAFVFGDNIDTDAIIQTDFLSVSDEQILAAHCMERISPGFHMRVSKGDILVAGENFGCGSSREQAPISIKGCGIACVVAKSFSRLFYRNAINIGLPVIDADIPAISDGEELSVDCVTGVIRIAKSGAEVSGAPLPEFMLEILRAGGLTGYLEQRLKARSSK